MQHGVLWTWQVLSPGPAVAGDEKWLPSILSLSLLVIVLGGVGLSPLSDAFRDSMRLFSLSSSRAAFLSKYALVRRSNVKMYEHSTVVCQSPRNDWVASSKTRQLNSSSLERCSA